MRVKFIFTRRQRERVGKRIRIEEEEEKYDEMFLR
jgi:hypothetical protein